MRWLAIALFAAGTTAAGADPLDDIGLGAAATAMANARAALATGAEAAHVNPAGIARISRPEVLAGWHYSHQRLELDGRDAGVRDAHGTSLALAIPLPIGEVQLATGLALYLPDRLAAHVQLPPASEPHFVRFQNAADRIVIEPVVALSLGRFAIGGGASIVVDARSNELAFDVAMVGGEQQGRGRIDMTMPLRAAPLLGVWWRPARVLELAATLRGELSLDVALDLRTDIAVPGVVTGDASVSLRSAGHFTPMRGALAAALHPARNLAITGEVAIERWSALGSGVPDVRTLVALTRSPLDISTVRPPASFRDVVTSRLGVEWRTGSLRLRAGAAYLPSPVPTQTGLTSFADGARTLATLGAGLRVPPGRVLLQPIDLDIAAGWQHVRDELVQKDMAMLPGGAFTSGGDILQANMTATVRF